MKIVKPDDDSPGWLDRLEKAERYNKLLFTKGGSKEGFLDLLWDYVEPFIAEPVDRVEARKELMMLSKNEYKQLIADINKRDEEGAENPTVAKTS